MKKNFTIEEVEILLEYIEKEEKNKLADMCQKLGAKKKDLYNVESMCYFIAGKIEINEEILEIFKNRIREQSSFKLLLPYFKKVDVIRYFVDNKENYMITDIEIKQMEYNLSKKNKDDIKRANVRQEKFWNKYGLILVILIEILLVICTINEAKPYLLTEVLKKANVTEATILKENKTISLAAIPTASIYLDYEYVIENVKYTKNDENVLVIGLTKAEEFEVGNKIKVYYYKNNYNNAKVYNYNKLVITWLFMGDLLFLVGIIKENKRRINKKK